MERKKTWSAAAVVLVAIAGAGLFLRLWGLGAQSLWIDEGFTINGALSVLEKGLPVLDSGAFYSNGILYTYTAAGAMAALGFDPFEPYAPRLPSALFGTALIVAVYALYREMFNDRAGALAAAFITAFAHWEIAWSRQARGYTAATLLLVIAFICFKRSVEGRAHRWLYALGAIASIAAACAFQGSTTAAIVGFGVALAHEWFARMRGPRWGSAIPLAIATLGVPLLVIALGILSGRTSEGVFGHYARVVEDVILLFLGGSLVALVTLFFGRGKDRTAAHLVSVIFVSLASIAAFSPTIQLRYAFPFFTLMIVLTVYGVKALAERLLGGTPSSLRYAASALVLLLATFPFLQIMPKESYRLEPGSPQPDFESAFRLVKEDRKAGDRIISGYAQLHKIYLGEKGEWLKLNLNNGPAGAEKRIFRGVDFYVGAPVLPDVDALDAAIRTSHGHIVVDAMTRQRIPGLFLYLETNERVSRIGYIESQSQIHVYRF